MKNIFVYSSEIKKYIDLLIAQYKLETRNYIDINSEIFTSEFLNE